MTWEKRVVIWGAIATIVAVPIALLAWLLPIERDSSSSPTTTAVTPTIDSTSTSRLPSDSTRPDNSSSATSGAGQVVDQLNRVELTDSYGVDLASGRVVHYTKSDVYNSTYSSYVSTLAGGTLSIIDSGADTYEACKNATRFTRTLIIGTGETKLSAGEKFCAYIPDKSRVALFHLRDIVGKDGDPGDSFLVFSITIWKDGTN